MVAALLGRAGGSAWGTVSLCARSRGWGEKGGRTLPRRPPRRPPRAYLGDSRKGTGGDGQYDEDYEDDDDDDDDDDEVMMMMMMMMMIMMMRR